MQSRHPQLRFRKIQKLGMLHVGSPSFHLTGCSLGQTEKAVDHARSARRKRWFCFLLFIAVLAAVGIAVGVTVGNNKK
jgi:hypothetical protein